MRNILLFLLALNVTSASGQKNLDSLYKTNVDYRRMIGVIYSEKYIVNSDVGDLTIFDQGHPDGRH